MRSIKQTPLPLTSLIQSISFIKGIASVLQVGDPSILYIDNSSSPIKTYTYSQVDKQYKIFDSGTNTPASKVRYFVYRMDFPQVGASDQFYIETGVSTLKCYVWSHSARQYIQISELLKEPSLFTTNPIKIMNNRCILPSTPLGNIVWNMALIYEDLTQEDFSSDGSLKGDRDYTAAEVTGFTLSGKAIGFAATDRSFLNNKHAVFSYLSRP